MRLRHAVLIGLVPFLPIRAQVSGMLPPVALRQLDQVDRDSGLIRRRKEVADSLVAGMRRWTAAGVNDYVLQTHINCFCVGDPFDTLTPMIQVRGGKAVGRLRGKATNRRDVFSAQNWTVEELFENVTKDAGDLGREIDTLILDPAFGFPRRYLAHTPGIADLWITIAVDSFAAAPRPKPPARHQ